MVWVRVAEDADDFVAVADGERDGEVVEGLFVGGGGHGGRCQRLLEDERDDGFGLVDAHFADLFVLLTRFLRVGFDGVKLFL